MERTERATASASDEGRYRLLVDAITDYAIYMLDPDGIITSWNAGAQRFKGYTADEILGSHFSRFFVPADRDAGLPQRALRIAAAEGRFETEGWRVRKDGGQFWAHVVLDPIRHADDTPHRLHQDHPRPDRAQAGAGGSAAQRKAVPAPGQRGQ